MTAPVPPSPKAYRADIDGLRALSIALVVLFHAGLDRFSGGYVGVDVFFVISGFLITGLLVKEAEANGRISMKEFYARRIRRLLPMAATTTITTVLLGLWLLPPTARERLVDDAIAGSLYVANWRYAGQSTRYSDTEVTDSLLVHYWSLSIEEQFYFLWPMLIVGGLLIAKRLGLNTRGTLLTLLGGLVAVSFAASIVLTNRLGVGAYYLTPTRLWEMGLGAGLALLITRIPLLPKLSATFIGAAGLVAIAWSAVSFDARTEFPGYAALVPVLGCVAVIVAGTHGLNPVSRLLGAPPLPLVGRLSYGWYLWHWPAIGLTLLFAEKYKLGGSENTLIAVAITGSFVLAWATHHLIENRVRHQPALAGRGRSLALGVALTLLPVAIAVIAVTQFNTGDTAVEVAGADGNGIVGMTPSEAQSDQPEIGQRCHSERVDVVPNPDCVFGDPDGDFGVVILGDSHARHWLPALDALGKERGWRVYAWSKSACAIIDVEIFRTSVQRPYTECTEWRHAVEDHVATLDRVDVVLLARSSGYRFVVMDGDEVLDPNAIGDAWSAGVERSIAAFQATGADVRLLADTPWPGEDVPGCVSSHLSELEECAYFLADAVLDTELLALELPVVEAAGARIVDPVPLVCPGEPCSVVDENGLIIYYDSHHLTVSFTLAHLDEIAALVVD